MLTSVVQLLGGGLLLYLGAEWLVGGAAGLARSFKVPQLLVGLTVVAWGTSAPEVVVGLKASLAGQGAIALGNVVGSNIANLGLILGFACLIKPARADGALRTRELPVLGVTTLLLPALLWDSEVSRLEGALLVLGSVAYTGWMVVSARATQAREAAVAAKVTEDAAEAAGAPRAHGRGRLAVTAAVGLAGLVLGGSLFVDGAVATARVFGLSERLIGLTIVAVGTSLPELATSLIAAWRGHSDIAVGNVVGSNIFNVLLCLGSAALAQPVAVPLASVQLDLVALGGMTAFGLVAIRTARHITRLEGLVLLGAYVAFLVALGLGVGGAA